jgi:cullin 1
VKWRTIFLPGVQGDGSKLTCAILRLTLRQRNGQRIDESLIKKPLNSFAALGIGEADLQKKNLDVYWEHFEVRFLDTTESFYKAESEAFLAKYGITEYLKKVEEWLREEEGRVERYLHESTKEPLIRKCEDVLIRERSELIRETLQSLPDRSDEDLERMNALLA